MGMGKEANARWVSEKSQDLHEKAHQPERNLAELGFSQISFSGTLAWKQKQARMPAKSKNGPTEGLGGFHLSGVTRLT